MLALLWTTSFPNCTIVDVRLDFATGHRFSGRATRVGDFVRGVQY